MVDAIVANLDMILSQAVNGLVLGFLYVLIATGLSIIFGMLGIVNFAHGSFFAIGAYLALTLTQSFGWPAALLAPVLTGLIGVVVEMTFIRQLYGKEPLLGLILTFALALFAEAVLKLIYGGPPLPFNEPHVFSGFFEYGPILITKYRIVVLIATVVSAVAFWAFIEFTPFGRIIRAGSRDPEMVGLLGDQSADRAERRVRRRLSVGGARRHARGADVDRAALDGRRRDHAGLRSRHYRRSWLLRRRHRRRPDGRAGHRRDDPVHPELVGRRDVCPDGRSAALTPARAVWRALGAL